MSQNIWIFACVGLAVACILALLLSPYASSAPDGLEKVAQEKKFEHLAAEKPLWDKAPLPDYEVPGIENKRVATGLAGVIGTVLIFVLAIACGKLLTKLR